MFVAVNYITCRDDYRERFEELFKSRAGAIDSMPGFLRMQVLRPRENGAKRNAYLVVSEWENEADFKRWTTSEAFEKGHRRGFADLKSARDSGDEPPMRSEFVTYDVLSR